MITDPQLDAAIELLKTPPAVSVAARVMAEIRQLPSFAASPLLRQGRLSVVPLTKEQWNALTKKTSE